MKIAVTIAAAAALALAVGAQAIDYVNWPNSVEPVFVSTYDARFLTNIATKDPTGEPWVVGDVGGEWGIVRATPEQAAAPAAPPPAGESLEFADRNATATPLYLVEPDGDRRLIDAEAYGPGGAAISPNGEWVIYAQWVGWVYGDSSVLYLATTDGSAAPIRLTPTYCGFSSSGPGALRGHCFQGSDGADRIVGTRYGDLIISGSGDDKIQAGDGQNEIQSQWGNDTIVTGSGHDEVWAGAGNDVIRTGAGSDLVIPGPGHDMVDAGRGTDYIYANDGERDVIDCGPGVDGVVADKVDVLRHCEHVSIQPPFVRIPAPR